MSSPEKTRSKRGRPAQLSRQQIVAAALDMLREKPQGRLGMQALARHMDVAPMSLYTHVRNREDLLKAIAEQVLGEVDPLPSQACWREALCAWAHGLRRQFLRYPFLAGLLRDGLTTPAAWLEVSTPLLEALRQAGLRGVALADAQRWFSRVVMGSILMEWAMPTAVPQEVSGVVQALQDMPPAQQGAWLEVLPQLGQQDDAAVFEYTLQRALDGLDVLVQRSGC